MELLETMLGELIAGVKAIAPEVWEIYLRQVYVQAVWNLIACLVGLGFGLWMISLLRNSKGYWAKAHTLFSEDFAVAIPGLGLVFSTLLFTTNLGMGLARIINPQYYALKDILLSLGIQ